MNRTNKIETIALVSLIILAFAIAAIPASIAANDNWTLVNDGRSLKAYSDLREYVWQKNASLAPNGPYDKIGLHRLVKTGITPKGVLFICPGTWSSGEQLISNPSNDTWTKYENYSQPVYWANRGFDVYSIDYRTHFVPILLNSSQLSFMNNWGWDQWISDIKEGVNKAKEVSGAKKIFMAGESFGGFATMNYAAEYWKEDLRGIILLDGGNATVNTNPVNSFNLTDVLNLMNSTKAWGVEYPNVAMVANPVVGAVFLWKYALANPNAPAEYPAGSGIFLTPLINPMTNKTWANITEWGAFVTYWGWTLPGAASNIYGGYGNTTLMVQWGASSDRYWPSRLTLESRAIVAWRNCPYVTYDFDDHYSEINLPLLGYTSGLYGFILWGPIGNQTNPDVTRVVLQQYGHGDVYAGVYTPRDVSAPTYDWMVNHVPPPLATSVTQSGTSITAGNMASFYTSVLGGVPPYTYQWFQGSSIVGNDAQLAFYPNTAGTYTYTCKITDAENTTTNTNALTLTVTAATTPAPATQAATPTPKVTPAPTAPIFTPTSTNSPSPTPTLQSTTTPKPTQEPTALPTATLAPSHTQFTLPIEATYAVVAVIAVIAVAAIALFIRKRKK